MKHLSANEVLSMTGGVTLITGASSGIGADLARVFAARGHTLVLAARRKEHLNAVADDIEASGYPRPTLIVCDLQDPRAGQQIAAAIAAQGVEVEILVNNAGYGLFGDAVDLDRDEQLGMIDLNIRMLTDLSLRFSDSIVRRKGGILNVGSIASFLPGPGMAVYYATKAFVLSFTEALRGELGPKGVRVTALCPGPVVTGFQDRAGFAAGLDSRMLDVSSSDVAEAGYRALQSNKQVALPGLGVRLIPFFLRFVPRGIVLWAVSKVQRRRR
jgi:short-subunit dehydrogenase